MDIVSRDIEKAEEEARREASRPRSHHSTTLSHESLHRVSTSSSGSSRSTVPDTAAVSRVNTQRDLERHPTVLSRIQTGRSQHAQTVASTRSRASSKGPLPAFGAGKPYPPPLPDREEYVVEFDGPDDPLHPMNWTMKRKLITAVILGFDTLTSAFASSIFSTATTEIAEIYNVSAEVGLLGLSFFVLGFGIGPLFWAPFSELKGRRLPLLVSCFGFVVFSFATATAKDLQTILICRFFGGCFAACPLSVVAAVFADIFDNRTRGLAVTVFSVAVFSGPLLAPTAGGFIVTSYLGWRWTMYLVGIMGSAAGILMILFLDETYAPVVLVNKAAELRRRTKNWGIHAKQEEIEVNLRELIEKNLSRPLVLLFTEPIVLLMSIYLAFVYGLLYIFFTSYAIVFEGVYGFAPGIAGLCYLGLIVGQFFAALMIVLMQPWYNRKLKGNNGVVVPEWRLPPAMAGAVAFAGGIFWFGWGGYNPDVHWIVPVLSGLLTGFGLLSIFLQILNYLIDSYLMFAASAIAANTLLRSLCGAGFPLFSTYMFEGIGINWGATVLGCFAVALIPLPVLFYFYGERIRRRSKYAPTFAAPKDEE